MIFAVLAFLLALTHGYAYDEEISDVGIDLAEDLETERRRWLAYGYGYHPYAYGGYRQESESYDSKADSPKDWDSMSRKEVMKQTKVLAKDLNEIDMAMGVLMERCEEDYSGDEGDDYRRRLYAPYAYAPYPYGGYYGGWRQISMSTYESASASSPRKMTKKKMIKQAKKMEKTRGKAKDALMEAIDACGGEGKFMRWMLEAEVAGTAGEIKMMKKELKKMKKACDEDEPEGCRAECKEDPEAEGCAACCQTFNHAIDWQCGTEDAAKCCTVWSAECFTLASESNNNHACKDCYSGYRGYGYALYPYAYGYRQISMNQMEKTSKLTKMLTKMSKRELKAERKSLMKERKVVKKEIKNFSCE